MSSVFRSPVAGCVTLSVKEAQDGAILVPDTPLLAAQVYTSSEFASTLHSSKTETAMVTPFVVTEVSVMVTQEDALAAMAFRSLPEAVLHCTLGVGLPYATQVNFTDWVAMALDTAGGRTTIAGGSVHFAKKKTQKND